MIALIRAAAVMLYPRTDSMPGIDECDLDAFLVRFKAESPLLMWVGVAFGALVFHLTPVLTVGWPVPAPLLPRHLQHRHAHELSLTENYLLRQIVFLLKFPLGLAWGAHPSVRALYALPPYPRDPGTWRAE